MVKPVTLYQSEYTFINKKRGGQLESVAYKQEKNQEDMLRWHCRVTTKTNVNKIIITKNN